jgi:transposase-like protein
MCVRPFEVFSQISTPDRMHLPRIRGIPFCFRPWVEPGALVQTCRSSKISGFAQHASPFEQEQPVQRPTLRARDRCPLRTLVPALQALVSRPGRDDGRARSVDRSHNNSALGSTLYAWVRRYTPEFDKRWSRFSAQAGRSWRVDETYVRVRGQWAYLYRAVDSSGKTIDFRLSPRRNVASAKAFFRKAIRVQGRSPGKITLDGYAASHRAVRELQQHGELADLKQLRSSKYLNNLIEQDHRNVKSRLGAMLGLKSFTSAAITILEWSSCIEFVKDSSTCALSARRGKLRPKSGQLFWLPDLQGS